MLVAAIAALAVTGPITQPAIWLGVEGANWLPVPAGTTWLAVPKVAPAATAAPLATSSPGIRLVLGPVLHPAVTVPEIPALVAAPVAEAAQATAPAQTELSKAKPVVAAAVAAVAAVAEAKEPHPAKRELTRSEPPGQKHKSTR